MKRLQVYISIIILFIILSIILGKEVDNFSKELFFNRSSAYGQTVLNVNLKHSCSYFGEPIKGNVYSFDSSFQARDLVSKIVNTVGLKPNFEIMAANVPNAAAVIQGSNRLILYSERFISEIKDATGTDWSAISILAHEIAHHLNGHTLDGRGSRPSKELEADEFSGFVLAKLGASLSEAQIAMRKLGSPIGSDTHPAKDARLEAITVGWKKGSLFSSLSSRELPPVPLTQTSREFYFKNECSEPIELLIRYKQLDGTWVTEGWWNFSPNERAYLTNSESRIRFDNSEIYYYAQIPSESYAWQGTEEITFDDETYLMRKAQLSPNSDGDWYLNLDCSNR